MIVTTAQKMIPDKNKKDLRFEIDIFYLLEKLCNLLFDWEASPFEETAQWEKAYSYFMTKIKFLY